MSGGRDIVIPYISTSIPSRQAGSQVPFFSTPLAIFAFLFLTYLLCIIGLWTQWGKERVGGIERLGLTETQKHV